MHFFSILCTAAGNSDAVSGTFYLSQTSINAPACGMDEMCNRGLVNSDNIKSITPQKKSSNVNAHIIS